MRKENVIKIKLLKLLEILKKYSDENNPISTQEILDKLEKQGIICDRRTLVDDIELLNNFGYEVEVIKE